MHPSVLQLDPRDNVLIALTDFKAAEHIEFAGHTYTLPKNVPAKHKFATRNFSIGDDVIMYGVLVGKAVNPIAAGELLTTTNIQHQAAPFREQSSEYHWSPPDISRWQHKTFQGFRRSDDQVGTRNYWLVVPLVFCENKNIQVLKQAFEEELGFAPPQLYRRQVAELAKLYREKKVGKDRCPRRARRRSSVPAQPFVREHRRRTFLLHEGGCGGTREDSNNLCGLIAGYLHHPNVAGGTVLSLGCQNAQIAILREEIRKRNPKFAKPLFILEQQRSGSEAAMMSDAIRQTFLGLAEANKAQRTPAPLTDLCVGLKCGGSDGFSGISANPAIGHTADLLAALGGRTILSEFPELCGVEQELINRGKNTAVGNRFIQLMRDYAARATRRPLRFRHESIAGQHARWTLDGRYEISRRSEEGRHVSRDGRARLSGVLDRARPESSMHAGQRCGVRDGASRRRGKHSAVHDRSWHADRKSDRTRREALHQLGLGATHARYHRHRHRSGRRRAEDNRTDGRSHSGSGY